MADRTSGIERVGIENFLILFATRAASRLIAGRFDDPEAGRTRGTGGAGPREAARTLRAGRTSGTRRTGLTLGWRLALAARNQEKGGQDYQQRETYESSPM